MATIIQASALTLYDVIQKFGLRQVDADDFALEWEQNLPTLSSLEQQRLDTVKSQYLHLAQRPVLETLVKMVVLSPLLDMAGLYDSPFWVTAETSIDLPIETESIIVRGKIDILVVQERLWIAAIEAKGGNYDVMLALPQALTYMMASPQNEEPVYGFCLNGRELFFVKLLKQPEPIYALSEVFSLSRRNNDLYPVLQILKVLADLSRLTPSIKM